MSGILRLVYITIILHNIRTYYDPVNGKVSARTFRVRSSSEEMVRCLLDLRIQTGFIGFSWVIYVLSKRIPDIEVPVTVDLRRAGKRWSCLSFSSQRLQGLHRFGNHSLYVLRQPAASVLLSAASFPAQEGQTWTRKHQHPDDGQLHR